MQAGKEKLCILKNHTIMNPCSLLFNGKNATNAQHLEWRYPYIWNHLQISEAKHPYIIKVKSIAYASNYYKNL